MPLARTGGKFHLDDAVTNLAGWGTTDEDNTISTDILQDAHVSIVDDATCAQFDPATTRARRPARASTRRPAPATATAAAR